MKNGLTVGIAVLGMTSAAFAGPVEPDAFASGTNISNSYATVTLSAFAGPQVNAGVYATSPLVGAGVHYTASTGSLSFAWDNSTSYANVWGGGASDMRADFTGSVNFVSIDIIGNNGSDYGFLSAYRADNSLIGTSLSGLVVLNQVVNVSVTSGAGDIAYIVAAGVGGDTVGLDNMNFQVIPLPTAAGMGFVGLGLIGLRRRR